MTDQSEASRTFSLYKVEILFGKYFATTVLLACIIGTFVEDLNASDGLALLYFDIVHLFPVLFITYGCLFIAFFNITYSLIFHPYRNKIDILRFGWGGPFTFTYSEVRAIRFHWFTSISFTSGRRFRVCFRPDFFEYAFQESLPMEWTSLGKIIYRSFYKKYGAASS